MFSQAARLKPIKESPTFFQPLQLLCSFATADSFEGFGVALGMQRPCVIDLSVSPFCPRQGQGPPEGRATPLRPIGVVYNGG